MCDLFGFAYSMQLLTLSQSLTGLLKYCVQWIGMQVAQCRYDMKTESINKTESILYTHNYGNNRGQYYIYKLEFLTANNWLS